MKTQWRVYFEVCQRSTLNAHMATIQTCVHRKGGTITTEILGLADSHLQEARAVIEKRTKCSARVVQGSAKLSIKGDVGDSVAHWLLSISQEWKLDTV